MKTAGIVAEYNPFHNGHKHQIDEIRKKDVSHIISCMSGNYVQRGDFAIFDKYKRAKMAVNSGVDLIIELPLQFSLSTAEFFAKGAVSIFEKMGVIDYLAFGAKTDNIDLFNNMVFLLNHKNLDVKKYLDIGLSFPKARIMAVKVLNEKLRLIKEKDIELMEEPNNILGFEYINSLNSLNSKIKPLIIKRHKVEHDSIKVRNEFASASKIRKLIYEKQDFYNFIPKNLADDYKKMLEDGVYMDKEKMDISILSYLKRKNEDDYKKIFGVSEGLENRIVKMVKTSDSLNELENKIKTKRYTMARIRRIIINTFLNIEKSSILKTLPYIKVLAFNKKGGEVLKRVKKTSTLEIVTKQKRIEKLDEEQANLEKKASSIYGYLFKKPYDSDWEYTKNTKIIN